MLLLYFYQHILTEHREIVLTFGHFNRQPWGHEQEFSECDGLPYSGASCWELWMVWLLHSLYYRSVQPAKSPTMEWRKALAAAHPPNGQRLMRTPPRGACGGGEEHVEWERKVWGVWGERNEWRGETCASMAAEQPVLSSFSSQSLPTQEIPVQRRSISISYFSIRTFRVAPAEGCDWLNYNISFSRLTFGCLCSNREMFDNLWVFLQEIFYPLHLFCDSSQP